MDCKPKMSRRAKEGYHKWVKGVIQPEEIKIMNIYAPNASTPNFIKQALIGMIKQTLIQL